MAIINLRDYYPFYTSDYFMEVPEDVVEMFKEFDRKEAAYRLRTHGFMLCLTSYHILLLLYSLRGHLSKGNTTCLENKRHPYRVTEYGCLIYSS